MCFASSRRESEWIDHTGTGLAYYCSLLSNEEVKLEQLDQVVGGSDTVIIPEYTSQGGSQWLGMLP